MYIFADETGDLGFDFQKNKTSKFFTIAALVCDDEQTVRTIYKAVKRTLNNKINNKKDKKNPRNEIKGTNTDVTIKKYFYKHVQACQNWRLYTIMLDKRLLLRKTSIIPNHHRIYNALTHQLLCNINFIETKTVNLIIDKSKGKLHLEEFNDYLTTNLDIVLPLNTIFNITHAPSNSNRGIQAVDLFAHGLYRKYEYKDIRWYSVFQDRICIECEYQI